MPSSLRTAMTVVAMHAITTVSGPAMMIQGHGSRYQGMVGTVLLPRDDERGLFMAHYLVVVDRLHDELDGMRLRLGERGHVVGRRRAQAHGQQPGLCPAKVDRLLDAHDLEAGKALRANT